MQRMIHSGRRGGKSLTFQRFCAELGIRHEGCLMAAIYDNGTVTAQYRDPSAVTDGIRGVRTVHWLRRPTPHR